MMGHDAESYAHFYRGMYGQQQFRVIGIRKDIAE